MVRATLENTYGITCSSRGEKEKRLMLAAFVALPLVFARVHSEIMLLLESSTVSTLGSGRYDGHGFISTQALDYRSSRLP